jgi:hypothetical protein
MTKITNLEKNDHQETPIRSGKRKCPPDERSSKEGGVGVVALRMHGARATMVTPRSSLLRKSVRVDRGDVGPPSNIKRWENCTTQDK